MTLTLDLAELRDNLKDGRNAVRRATEGAEARVEQLIQRVRLMEALVVPDEVRGFVRNYRYGMDSSDVHPSGVTSMPTHRFELDCGQQVWLHVVVGSDKWDNFMAAEGRAGNELIDSAGRFATEFWEGQRLLLRRDTDYGRFIPVALLSQDAAGIDRNQKPLYVDEQVLLIDAGITMELAPRTDLLEAKYGSNYVQGRRSDGETGVGDFDEQYGGKLYVARSKDVEPVR